MNGCTFMSVKIALHKYSSQVPVINKLFSRQFKVLFFGKYYHTFHSYFSPLHEALVSLFICLWPALTSDLITVKSNGSCVVLTSLDLSQCLTPPSLCLWKVSCISMCDTLLCHCPASCFFHGVIFLLLPFHMSPLQVSVPSHYSSNYSWLISSHFWF